jgi:hypothetical protein
MKKTTPANSPDAYVNSLYGWKKEHAENLKDFVLSVGGLDEVIKWGHLVYFSNGPVLLIRAEEKECCLDFGGDRDWEVLMIASSRADNTKWAP